jgi:hypothetical protein
MELGIETDICFCLGTGKNYKFLIELNNKLHLFRNIVALEHPRFIMQYKTKQKKIYIDKYISEFNRI